MLKRRYSAAAVGLAMLGLMGLVMVAWGQGGTNTAAVQEYEKRIKALDQNKPDALYALAKWCFSNKLYGEARALALEVLQKSPDDVRAKYLLYALASGPIVGTRTSDVVKPDAQITEVETEALFKRETEPVMRGFRDIQKILLTSCGTSKCHSSLNPDAKWSLVDRDQTSRKTLAQNFQAINRYINRDNLIQSVLLAKPTKGRDAGHPDIVIKSTSDPVYLKLTSWMATLKTATGIIWGEAGSAPPPPPPSNK